MPVGNHWSQLLFLQAAFVNAADRRAAIHLLDVDSTSFVISCDPIETAMFAAAASKLAELAGVVNLQITMEESADLVVGFGKDGEDARQRLITHFKRRATQWELGDLANLAAAIRGAAIK